MIMTGIPITDFKIEQKSEVSEVNSGCAMKRRVQSGETRTLGCVTSRLIHQAILPRAAK